MAIETNAIKVDEDTTLDEVLDAADDAPLTIERDGVEYLVFRDTLNTSDEWDEERAERVRKVLRETAGIWKDVDVSGLVNDLTLVTFNRRHFERIPNLRVYADPTIQ